MPENKGPKRKTNSNFILITLIFLGGLTIFQFFMANSLRAKYDIQSSNTIFQINDDQSVAINTNITMKAEDENSFDKLIDNFNTPDQEKEEAYVDNFSEIMQNVNREFEVISYESTMSTANPNLSIEETVTVMGFTERLNSSTIEFSLPGQPLNVKDSIVIEYPENWTIRSIVPQPSQRGENFVIYEQEEQIDFPRIVFDITY
ncbi:MAG: DUF4897 domain-containing protein [Thermotogota bacterium]